MARKSTKATLTVHGKPGRSPFSMAEEDGGCRPECHRCGTGMVCASANDEHYCAYAGCPANDRERFTREYPR